MATNFSAALFPDNSTDAHFQAWALFFENTLVTIGGWTLSLETGDTPPGSLLHPTVANTKKGFRIYRMADALQSTAPIVMRIDYGSGSVANTPAIWYTIGTGSDGAGTVTGILFNGGISATPQVSSNSNQSTGTFNSYGSAMPNRAAVGMFVSTNATFHFVFTIGRTKDSSGNDTNEGILLVYRDGTTSNSITLSRYIIYAGGTQPTAETGLSYILTTRNPSETFGGDIGVGIVSHFKGVAQQPGTNFLITNSNDVSAEGTVTLTLYTSSRTYVQLNALIPLKALTGASAADNNARCLMRYD